MRSTGIVLMVSAIIFALVACVYVPWVIFYPSHILDDRERVWEHTSYEGHFCLWNPPSAKRGHAQIHVTIVVLELLGTSIIGLSGYLLYRKGTETKRRR
jgi:hypothetical protein